MQMTITVLLLAVTLAFSGCVSTPAPKVNLPDKWPSPIPPSTPATCPPRAFGPTCRWLVLCTEDHARAALSCIINPSGSDLVLGQVLDKITGSRLLVASFLNHVPGESGALRIGEAPPLLVTDAARGLVSDPNLRYWLGSGEAKGEQLHWSHSQRPHTPATQGVGSIPLAGLNEAFAYTDGWLASHE